MRGGIQVFVAGQMELVLGGRCRDLVFLCLAGQVEYLTE